MVDLQARQIYFKFRPECRIAMGDHECEGVAKICASRDPFFQEDVENDKSPCLSLLTAGQQ